MVQVRAHELNEQELEQLARNVVSSAGNRALVIVNGSKEVAVKAGADGVHLTENSPSHYSDISGGLIVGKSVHSLENALRAHKAGIDYVVLGTIFQSASHPDGETGGLARVAEVTGKMSTPVIAIGGITARNAGDVVAAGASGIAVIGAIIEAQDPREAANELAVAIGLADK